MSDDQNAKLLTRLAAMEQELATLRNAERKPTPQFDPVAFRTAFVNDPVGVLSKMGAPIDHVTRVLVANAMGDQAPQELKVLAAMGPQLSAAQALEAKVEALSRQLSDQGRKGTRESFQALATDKTKNPHLAKALSADPTLFDEDVASHGGSAEELAAKLETRLGKFSAVYAPPPVSEQNTETTVQSTQDTPAIAGALSGSVPPISQPTPGVFKAEDHQKLRDEVLRKHA